MNKLTTTARIAVIAALAASLAISSVSSIATQAFAEKGKTSDKKIDPNMDIKKAYRDGNNLVVKVKGVAGGTTPPEPPKGGFGHVYGYAFTLADASIWVLNAHWECHPQSGCDPGQNVVSVWHAEKVTLDKIGGQTCVTSIFDETLDVTTNGHIGSIHVLNPAKIVKAQSVDFQLNIHPDTAPEVRDPNNLTCVAYFVQQFDEWTPKSDDDRQEHD